MTTRTNERGRYTLPLPLGTYTVSEEFKPNWTQKYPLSGTWSIRLTTPDTLVDSIHFGNYTQASFVNGRVFHDLNQDGRPNDGEPLGFYHPDPRAGGTAFADLAFELKDPRALIDLALD